MQTASATQDLVFTRHCPSHDPFVEGNFHLGFDVREVQPPLFYAVHFGTQKINFHGPRAWRSPKFTLRGPRARPGCGDFCFVWSGTEAELAARLAAAGAPVVEGPVRRDGGAGRAGVSVYIRDPDDNLLEFIRYPA